MLLFLIAVSLFEFSTAIYLDAGRSQDKNEIEVTIKTPINMFEYQLSLYNGDVFICGATMISSEWAITTAHCAQVKKKSDLNLKVGISADEVVSFPITTIVTHPNFDEHTLDFDYALLKAKWPFKTMNGVDLTPVTLPKVHEKVHPNMHANVSGWGTTKDGEEKESMDFKYSNVTIYSIKMCKTYHKGLTKRMICAGDPEHPENSCQGDTGGPLVSREKLVGMVSWGQHCVDSNKPVVYAAINPISKWIRKHMGI